MLPAWAAPDYLLSSLLTPDLACVGPNFCMPDAIRFVVMREGTMLSGVQEPSVFSLMSTAIISLPFPADTLPKQGVTV